MLLAFVILVVVAVTSGVPTGPPTREVAAVSAGTPAAEAGLRPGDRIVAVDGHATKSFGAVSRLIRSSRGAPITVTVIRDGVRATLGPRSTIRQNGAWIWCFNPGENRVRYPIGRSLSNAVGQLWQVTTGTASGLAALFHSRDRRHLSSVIGISRYSAKALSVSTPWYFEILAFVSMSLALLNLIPLLPLDGGHILFSLIEGIRKRALAREVYERFSVIGLALILLVMVIAGRNDTRHWFG